MKILLIILLLVSISFQENCLVKRSQYTDATREQISNAEGGILDLNTKSYRWKPQLPAPSQNQFIRLWVNLAQNTNDTSYILWTNGHAEGIEIQYNRLNNKLRFIMKPLSSYGGSQPEIIEVQTAGEIFNDYVLISVKFTDIDFMVYYQGVYQETKPYPINPKLHQFQGEVKYDFDYANYGTVENINGFIKDIEVVQDIDDVALEGCFTVGNPVEICQEDQHGNCLPQTPQDPLDQCEEGLKNLQSMNVNIDFIMVDVGGGIMEHQYTINFGGFVIQDRCYDIQLYLGQASQHIPHTVESAQKLEIYANFQSDQAVSFGCVDINPRKLECQFKLALLYQGHEQMTKNFTSVISTETLDNIQNGLQLQIISDNSDQIKTIGANVETEVNICEDSTCSSYKSELKMIRNEIAYVELKINSPQYVGYYPVHKSLKLNAKEFLPENLSEVQSWQQPGKIIYQVKPHIASDSIYLMIQVSIQADQPTPGARFLQQQQQQQQQPSNNDLLGKQVMVVVIDKEDLKSEDENGSSDTALVLGVTLGSLAFVSFSISTVAFAVVKMKKMALIAKAAQVSPTPQQPQIVKGSDETLSV